MENVLKGIHADQLNILTGDNVKIVYQEVHTTDAFLGEEPEADMQQLPKAINTTRAQQLFQKAFDRGYMKYENGHFRWIGVGRTGHKSQLAYFLGRVYGYRHSVSGNTGTEFPTDELNALFGETKLYDLLVQVHTAQKIQKWRALIDDIFE